WWSRARGGGSRDRDQSTRPRRRRSCQAGGALRQRRASRRLGQLFFGDLLHFAGLGLALVRLHHLAHHAAGHLHVLCSERRDRGAHSLAQLVGGQAARQEAVAELDLPRQLGRLVLAALADRKELVARFHQRLLVGRDHVQDQRVVDLTREPFRGAALHHL